MRWPAEAPWRRFVLAAAAALAALVACQMPPVSAYQYECATSSACPEGTSCTDGCCIEPGQTPACRAAGRPGPSGSPCLVDTDCTSNRCDSDGTCACGWARSLWDGGTILNGGSITPTTNAKTYRGMNGQRIAFSCRAASIFGTIYGTDTYTDESSICGAGVHSWRIQAATGGTVTIEILPGASCYTHSKRNGVTSYSYSASPGSFNVVP